MSVYHTVMEAYNITNKTAFGQFQKKLNMHKEKKHSERSAANNELYVPQKTKLNVHTGFSYLGPKLYNVIPKNIKNAKSTDDFKTKLKG